MTGSGPLPGAGRSELDRLRQSVSTYFPVYETRIGPQSVQFAVHVDPARLAERFEALRRELSGLGYIPILRRETGEQFVEVVRRPRIAARRPWVNLVLLGATVATTIFAGSMIWLTWVGRLTLQPTDVLYGALYFAAPLLAILGVHESAHFVVARRRHLDASLPYFIPIPPPYPLGTFGAFVSIREPFPDRKTLFDVGVAGPIAGFAMSIPIALAGLSLSAHAPVVPLSYCPPAILGQSYGNYLLGPSLFWAFLALFFPKSIVALHPLAFAGWVGVLITAINLLPAGSLDGGHVFRALAGERARYVSYGAAAALVGLGFLYLGWLLFALVVLLIGLRHPPPLNDVTRLDRKRLAVGALAIGILVSGFVIVPLALPPGNIALTPWDPVAVHPPAGEAVASWLNVTITNDDPVGHGYLYTYAVRNVSVNGSYLSGAALAAWQANASWVFVLPNGSRVGPFAGAAATVPAADFLSIDGGASVNATVEFLAKQPAGLLGFGFTASQLCPPSGVGPKSTGLPQEAV